MERFSRLFFRSLHLNIPLTRYYFCNYFFVSKYRSLFGYSLLGAGAFQDDQKMCIQYLSGKIEGFMAKDYVCVGALCVSEQVFGMADIIDVPLLDEVVWDGIIGLAFPNDGLEVKYIYCFLFCWGAGA